METCLDPLLLMALFNVGVDSSKSDPEEFESSYKKILSND